MAPKKKDAPQSNLEKQEKNTEKISDRESDQTTEKRFRLRMHLGIHEFWKSKSGRNFLLVMEGFLAAAFFATPHLYYNGSYTNILQRFYADSLSICGILFAALVFLTIKQVDFSEKMNRRITRILTVAMPFVAFLWLEFYNDAQFWVPIFRIPLSYFLLNLALYYAIFYLLLLIFGNIRNTSIVMILITAMFGFMNYELTVFRSMSFIASDLFSAMTALSVANTYTIQMDVDSAEYLLGALVIVAALLKLKKIPVFHKKRQRLAYLAGCALMCGLICEVYVFSSFLHDIGVDFRVYRPQYKYRYYGTLLTTARTFGYLHVTEPKGYSVEEVKRIISDFEDTQKEEMAGAEAKKEETQKTENATVSLPEKQPNVIVIMNESFADLKEVGDLTVSQDYMPFFRSLKNTIKGYTYSSVFGGNTANSEFEFLTGNTLAFLPDNSVPYQLFLRSETPGLTRTLKDQGYGPCYALHPYYNTGYSRYRIYPLMGFDQFYCSDDFSVFTDTVNYHITDEEDYRKLISLYEQNREDGKPFYCFNVTMQNHGSYDGSTLETGDEIQLEGSYRLYSKTEQYLNMIKMSDDALKGLVEYFEKVEEPTVIVFFGDHQPDLDEEFYDALLKTKISDLEGEELEKLYRCPFLMWANYKIKDQYVDRTSNNYLTTYLAEITGMKTTGYLDYLTKLRQKIPCINALGYWGDDGNFYNLHDQSSPYYKRLKEYNYLEYNNIFGKEKQISSFFHIQ